MSPRPLHVAMVSNHASPLAVLGGDDAGGQNVHVAALSQALAARGVRVTVYTRREAPEAPRRVPFTNGVVVEHVDAGPPRYVPKDEHVPFMEDFAASLEATWSREPPDVVHANFWLSGLASLTACRAVGLPMVQTFHALGVVKRRHQGTLDTSPPERLRVERWLVEDADHIIATCSDEVFELVRLGGNRKRMTVVPCGVNLGNFNPDGPALDRPDGLHRLVVVSRLVPRKGIDDVIRALPAVPDTELLIAGGPPAAELDSDAEIDRLRAVARQVGVPDRVRFLGRLERHQVPPLMRSADALVTTPWYEPFGIVPVEAMACGVPVVASAVGGMIDTVKDGVTGLHVPARDPTALGDALRRLLEDEPRRRAMGEAGIRRARERYGWDRVADATAEVLRSVSGSAVPSSRMSSARRAEGNGTAPGQRPLLHGDGHVAALRTALDDLDLDVVDSWGRRIARTLADGGRVLACGNGGSAAQAQHLTAELVGRYRDDRRPFSAIALHAETSSLTAICNDYGAEVAFARQVEAHGRPGDVLVALSTSGRSANVLAAVDMAKRVGVSTLGVTGAAPNPLAEACDGVLTVPAEETATIQEAHLVLIHLLCAEVELAIGSHRLEHIDLTEPALARETS